MPSTGGTMNARKLLTDLIAASNSVEAHKILETFIAASYEKVGDRPVGLRPNNRGTIEVATDPARSIVERITNAIDALLELEHDTHNGRPLCRSPRQAAQAWFGINENGLGSTAMPVRQKLARRTVVQLEPGLGREKRTITIRDTGSGILPERMPGTILSLNESNKWQKHYLAGTFGQGGSSTFAFCELTLIASRKYRSKTIGFTVVWYKDLPDSDFKSGQYVYLTFEGSPFGVPFEEGDPLVPQGTLIKHFGYDLSSYAGAYGERSLYGAMNRLLFDPVAPIWFENKVNDWNRGIYGSRTRLNSGSDDEGQTGITLSHNMPTITVGLGDEDYIGIEYWVLPLPEGHSVPSNAYVDAKKPIVLTINGQNQSELSSLLIRKDAELPYLKSRLICHIDCDALTSKSKRALFASTREQAKEGLTLARIKENLIAVLKSDDELVRLNREAKDKSLSSQDEDVKRRLRREVAKMLTLTGRAREETKGTQKGDTERAIPAGRQRGPRKVQPLTTNDPPTYITIVAEAEEPVKFFPSQRKWLRVETDAPAHYHDTKRLKESKINVVIQGGLKLVGTSSLKGGRMRIAVDCDEELATGSTGTIQIVLSRAGMAALEDTVSYIVSDPPKQQKNLKKQSFPDFEIIPVEGPDDPNWQNISEDDVDIQRNASRGLLSEGVLNIYYSKAFPKFVEESRKWDSLDVQKAKSFQRRYEVWLAVHALLMQENESDQDQQEEDQIEKFWRDERCRVAVLASMIASQEVRTGEAAKEEDD
jgi:hypothetical protein